MLFNIFNLSLRKKTIGKLHYKKSFKEDLMLENEAYFDNDGYGIDGFNKEGLDKAGFNRGGYNKEGFDRSGFDRHGFNIHGYTREGFDREGYDKNGYDKDEIDRSGYDKDGFDKKGYNIHGFDIHGYNVHGFNIHGYNKEGFNIEGYNKSGYDQCGYDRYGYDRKGFDRQGFDKQGYNITGDFHGFIDFQIKEMYSLHILNSNNLYNESVKNLLLYLKLAKESIKSNNIPNSIKYSQELAYLFCDELLKDNKITPLQDMNFDHKLKIIKKLIVPNKYLEVLCFLTKSEVLINDEDSIKKCIQALSNMVGELISKINRKTS